MLAVLTPWGLAIWRHGTSAPLWRALVSPANSVWLNWLAVLVVAGCYAYVVSKLAFGRRSEGLSRHPLARLTVVFSVLPFFVIPALARHVVEMSPFYFSLVPSAVALALMFSQATRPREEWPDDNERDVGKASRNLRLLLCGAFAAVGVWEGLPGLVVAVVLFFPPFFRNVRGDRSVSQLLVMYLLGFLMAFVIEGTLLDWPWGVFRPIRTPVVGVALFGLLSVLPLLFVRTLGPNPWVLGCWGAVLAVLLTNAVMHGYYWRPGPCEQFVRAVLANLNDRELIIGDGLTDDFFRVMKPDDVRLVGTRSFEDREFLISFFGEDEPVSDRALVVRDYYYLPETEAMMGAYGLRLSKLGKTLVTARQIQALTPAVWEAKRVQAETNQFLRMLAFSGPVVRSVNEMLDNYAKIPLKMRRKKIEEARTNIRRGWLSGMAGPTLSSTVLSLDVLLDDWDGAESDALTALTIDREDPAANTMLGSLRLRKLELAPAEAYLRKGVKGGGSGAYNDYALILLRTGRAAKAEEWARLAVRKSPDNWNYRETLVQILTELKMPDEALAELKEIERLAKEQGQFDIAREPIREHRNKLLRLRSVSSDKWGE